MATRQPTHTFVISAQMAEKRFTGFIDMLRYDQAQVLEGDSSMIVLSSPHAPTEGRWVSFGIYVLAQMQGEYPDIRGLRLQAQDRLPV